MARLWSLSRKQGWHVRASYYSAKPSPQPALPRLWIALLKSMTCRLGGEMIKVGWKWRQRAKITVGVFSAIGPEGCDLPAACKPPPTNEAKHQYLRNNAAYTNALQLLALVGFLAECHRVFHIIESNLVKMVNFRLLLSSLYSHI